MLKLINVKKEYNTGDIHVEALKGITLNFRKNEFVSILGPSGCGKTTTLNIIGGLDKYSHGDIVINNKSTKNFTDRDWDAYRNHSIGFVFQSYNLIPHQTVLQNVELALTLSGVSKAKRRSRAIKALESVGLSDQINKKPCEMSGGQMQRVAIARAIVNDPDIILADEPTGALDSETSIAVMDILKEISKERLVIMVTHNPELAEKYSTRIIKMLDGLILSDSNPLIEDDKILSAGTEKENTNAKKPSMSLFTSFGLSLKNLITKKGRTILTSFAGSIGIIGIALIFAVSHGMTAFINSVQEDTLSSYPLMLESQHTDLGSIMENFMNDATSHSEHGKDAVYQKDALYDLVNTLNSVENRENDLKSFKEYLENERNNNTALNNALNGIKYTYNYDLLIYTKNIDGEIIVSDTEELMSQMLIKFMGNFYGVDSDNSSNSMNMFSPITSTSGMWQELLSGDNGTIVNEMIKEQYDIIYGNWPTKYNEIVLIVDENNELDDITLYALGLKSKEDIDAIINAAENKNNLEFKAEKWSYEEICNTEFRTVLNADCFIFDDSTNLYTDLRETNTGIKYLYDNAIKLKVSGIIRPNADAVSSMLSGSSIGYTHLLTEYISEKSKNSQAIIAQLENKDKDIFSGLPFEENTGNLKDNEKEIAFKNHIESLSKSEKAKLFVKIKSIPSEETLNDAVNKSMQGLTRENIETSLIDTLKKEMGMKETEIKRYIKDMSDEDLTDLYSEIIAEGIKIQYAENINNQLQFMSDTQLVSALESTIPNYSTEECARLYDLVLEFSDSSYNENLSKLGYIDLNTPSSINLYASSFENKDIIEDIIKKYNDNVDELSKITYTDYVGIMMSSVTTIINAITYVLVAFVGVSLIVSSIMIGVITLISVQERTKEIGILRAIGASKKNVSSMFNAETVIIGFTSGLLGVVITYLLCIPINAILHHLTGLSNLTAILPWQIAVALIIISVLLTLVSGIIPSASAAKKDPVVALRTE